MTTILETSLEIRFKFFVNLACTLFGCDTAHGCFWGDLVSPLRRSSRSVGFCGYFGGQPFSGLSGDV